MMVWLTPPPLQEDLGIAHSTSHAAASPSAEGKEASEEGVNFSGVLRVYSVHPISSGSLHLCIPHSLYGVVIETG